MGATRGSRLCLACGTTLSHAAGCPEAPAPAASPADKEARVLAAVREAGERADEAESWSKSGEHRRAILLLLDARDLLERHPSSDLTSFEDKRTWNAADTRLGKVLAEAQKALPDEAGARLAADFAYARKAIELLYALALRRFEAWDTDVGALATLPDPIKSASDTGAELKEICAEVDSRIKASAALDKDVEGWGWANLRPLMLGEEPFHYPDHLLGNRVTQRLTALVGRVAGTRRDQAREKFRALSVGFRERLYLLGANAILWRTTSRLAQAEEAWKRHSSREDPKRWPRIQKEDRDLLRALLGEDADLEAGADKAVTRLVRTGGVFQRAALRPFGDIPGEEWDAFARAYLFERAAVHSGTDSSGIGLEPVARVLLEVSRDSAVDAQKIAALLKQVQDAWRQSPPKEPKREG